MCISLGYFNLLKTHITALFNSPLAAEIKAHGTTVILFAEATISSTLIGHNIPPVYDKPVRAVVAALPTPTPTNAFATSGITG